MMSLAEYAVELLRTDWAYEFSDDFRVYRIGLERVRWMRQLSQQSEDHLALYNRAVWRTMPWRYRA